MCGQRWGKSMSKTEVWVFGSNLAGRHGKGAALTAAKTYKAQRGVGTGRTGNAYAIPTKDHDLKPLPLAYIKTEVENFKVYAGMHPELHFTVTKIGCGLAGYREAEIGPMFNGVPSNCTLPLGWEKFR